MLINAPQRGNVSKACKIVCQEMIPACSDDTVHKLRDLHPERSLNLNLENLPTPESLNAFWDGEESTTLRNNFFSVTEVRKYFRTFQALAVADICFAGRWAGIEVYKNGRASTLAKQHFCATQGRVLYNLIRV